MKITPKRRELLQAILAGQVREHYPLGMSAIYSEWDRGPGWAGPGLRHLTVTSEMAKLRAAGLVLVGEKESDSYKTPRRWVLTNRGRKEAS
jgi:hypothetical protein